MKLRLSCLVLLGAAALSAAASDSLVTNLVVRPRRPWSCTVDIDYVYTGHSPTSMSFTATWDGQSEPVDLVTVTSGSITARPGQNTFAWDPVAAGYGDADLVDFKVALAPIPRDPRTYLVVDLEHGGYTTLADIPAGGWTDEHKTTKMVLKRLSAGTYRWARRKRNTARRGRAGSRARSVAARRFMTSRTRATTTSRSSS